MEVMEWNGKPVETKADTETKPTPGVAKVKKTAKVTTVWVRVEGDMLLYLRQYAERNENSLAGAVRKIIRDEMERSSSND